MSKSFAELFRASDFAKQIPGRTVHKPSAFPVDRLGFRKSPQATIDSELQSTSKKASLLNGGLALHGYFFKCSKHPVPRRWAGQSISQIRFRNLDNEFDWPEIESADRSIEVRRVLQGFYMQRITTQHPIYRSKRSLEPAINPIFWVRLCTNEIPNVTSLDTGIELQANLLHVSTDDAEGTSLFQERFEQIASLAPIDRIDAKVIAVGHSLLQLLRNYDQRDRPLACILNQTAEHDLLELVNTPEHMRLPLSLRIVSQPQVLNDRE